MQEGSAGDTTRGLLCAHLGVVVIQEHLMRANIQRERERAKLSQGSAIKDPLSNPPVVTYRHGLTNDAKSAPKQEVTGACFSPQRKSLLKLLGDCHQWDLGWNESFRSNEDT